MLDLAGIFKDHMVLQRDSYIPIWGTAPTGSQIYVTLENDTRCVEADKNGMWEVQFPPRFCGGPYTMSVTCDDISLTISDIMVGDVWFAGGQSNMEMPLRDCKNGQQEVAQSDHPDIRFYRVPRHSMVDEMLVSLESDSSWKVCSPVSSGELSAVAYFYACHISQAQNVPIGIIDCAWGGTSISCWMSEQTLEKSIAGRRYIENYNALIGGKHDEAYQQEMAAYEESRQAWQNRVDALRANDPKLPWMEIHRLCGDCPWPQPAGNPSPFKPANLYHAMIRRVAPYAIRGFLYYQGEADVERCHDYADMMIALIDQWRTDWRNDFLPFLFVQLPMYASAEDYAAHRDDRRWAVLRDQQLKVSRVVANTAIAILTDCGEFDNIHPMDKQTVALRLALLARKKYYGENTSAHEPTFVHAEAVGDRMEVLFRSTGGLLAFRGDALEGFELAGSDGVFRPAHGIIQLGKVILHAEGVDAPKYVRYAWGNYHVANHYGTSGLPAAPFRTDSFPIY